MNDVSHLLTIIDEYLQATGTKEVTLSFWVFNDSKKISSMRERGADITLGRFNHALTWFSARWPDGAVWPENVVRPEVERAA